MAKRFGRNQRRRAREAIANLQEAVERERGLNSYLGRENGRLRDEISAAKRIAGEMGILFPAKTTEVLDRPRPGIEVATFSPISLPLSGPMVSEPTFRKIPLEVLLSRVNDDALRDAVHVRVQFAGKEVGYAISRFARMSVPAPEMVRIVSGEISHMLAPQMLIGRERQARQAA